MTGCRLLSQPELDFTGDKTVSFCTVFLLCSFTCITMHLKSDIDNIDYIFILILMWLA